MPKYVPGKFAEEIAREYGIEESDIIKLGSNENPLGVSPLVSKAICKNLDTLNIYPPIDAADLRKAIAEYIGVPFRHILVGNGVDGVLDTLARLFINEGDEAVIPTPTFSFYQLSASILGGKPVFLPRDANFDVQVDKLLETISERTKMIYLCTPNNPTGNMMREEDIGRIAESTDAMVIVDEAYVEFADKNVAHLATKYDNVVVTRTFSKAFGLAGLRVGYCIAPEWMYSEYMKVYQPFSVNRLGVIAGMAALRDKEHLERTLKVVREGRTYLIENLPFRTYPSQANFVMINVEPYTSGEVTEYLLRRGIIVRDCASFTGEGTDRLIRITVGTMGQNRVVVEALKAFLEEH